MAKFINFLSYPFSFLFNFIYSLSQNYGVAIIVLTIIYKYLLNYKTYGFKSRIKTRSKEKKELLAQILDETENNPEERERRLIEYQDNGGGYIAMYLPAFLSVLVFFIFIAFTGVILNPLTYIFKLSPDQISGISSVAQKTLHLKVNSTNLQTALINTIQANPIFFTEVIPEEILTSIVNFNVNFLGINLTNTASFVSSRSLIIPGILIALTVFEGIKGIYGLIKAGKQTPIAATIINSVIITAATALNVFLYYTIIRNSPQSFCLYLLTRKVLSFIFGLLLKKKAKDNPEGEQEAKTEETTSATDTVNVAVKI